MQHAVNYQVLYLGTLPRYYLALPAPPAPPRKGLGGLEGRILQRSTQYSTDPYQGQDGPSGDRSRSWAPLPSINSRHFEPQCYYPYRVMIVGKQVIVTRFAGSSLSMSGRVALRCPRIWYLFHFLLDWLSQFCGRTRLLLEGLKTQSYFTT